MQILVLPKSDYIVQNSDYQRNKISQFCCMKSIEIGKEIKKVLDQRGMTQAQFAIMINKTRQTVQDILVRKSIDTELLLKISEVLGFDFFALYSQSQPYVLEVQNELKVAEAEVTYLTKQNRMSQQLAERQEEEIRLMKLVNTVFLHSKTTVVVTLFNKEKLTGTLWDIDTTNKEEVSFFYVNKTLVAFGLILSQTEKEEKFLKAKKAEIGNIEFLKQYVRRIDLREVDSIVLFEKDKGLSMN